MAEVRQRPLTAEKLPELDIESANEANVGRPTTTSKSPREPVYNHNGHLVTRGIHPDGESGRSGFHIKHFLQVCMRSSCTASKYANLLWPFVPAAIAVHYARPDLFRWVFALNYIAMVPTANLIGFAGQELARKLPTVFGTSVVPDPAKMVLIRVSGIILETFLGSVVEIVLFMVLLAQDEAGNLIPVIQVGAAGA